MLKKQDFVKIVKRPYPPLFTSLILQGVTNKKFYQGILKEELVFLNFINIDHVFYYGKQDMERASILVLESWKDPEVFAVAQKEFRERGQELERSATQNFENFCNAYLEYMPTVMLLVCADKPVDAALRGALLKKVSVEEASDIVSKLNVLLEDNIYKQEERELLTTTDILAHVEKYKWLNARYGDEIEYTIADAKLKLASLNKDDLGKQEAEKKELESLVISTKELLGSESYLLDIFQYIVYYRTHRTDIMNKSTFFALPMMKAKAKELGLKYSELLYCTFDEVLINAVPAKEVLFMRMNGCSLMVLDGKFGVQTGEEYRDLVHQFKEETAGIIELKGVVACKGNAQGIVKVISSKQDYEFFQEGNILVTSMTTPDMVPLMKKAAAIVTDEGGITCHAAIISRELNKPCIIATKNSTQVFRDGDTVEVDATKGIVTIIK